MDEIVRIHFSASRSSQYKTAILLARSIPGYTYQSSEHKIQVSDLMQYITHQETIHSIIDIVHKWKSATVSFYGKPYKSAWDYFEFLDKLKLNSGKYSVLLNQQGEVALGSVTMEDLPLPIVYYPSHYGAFFTFSKDLGEDIFFCECERRAITNYIRLRSQMPLQNYTGPKTYPLGEDAFPPLISELSKDDTRNPLDYIKFASGICFRCNRKMPKKLYCHPMYGDKFTQHYGWYKKQEYFRLGIDDYQIADLNILKDECKPELYDSLRRLHFLMKQEDIPLDEIHRLHKDVDRLIENSVRVSFGFKNKGEAWVSETILFHIISKIYSEQDVIRHYRPKWLEGLELDVFVPEIGLGFEYQGIQHFQPVEHWGGLAQFHKQQENDKRKRQLCLNMGIRLICIDYDEPLTEEYVRQRIQE